jgi:hypothetical protein
VRKYETKDLGTTEWLSYGSPQGDRLSMVRGSDPPCVL